MSDKKIAFLHTRIQKTIMNYKFFHPFTAAGIYRFIKSTNKQITKSTIKKIIVSLQNKLPFCPFLCFGKLFDKIEVQKQKIWTR
jgi:hypothetical protein